MLLSSDSAIIAADIGSSAMAVLPAQPVGAPVAAYGSAPRAAAALRGWLAGAIVNRLPAFLCSRSIALALEPTSSSMARIFLPMCVSRCRNADAILHNSLHFLAHKQLVAGAAVLDQHAPRTFVNSRCNSRVQLDGDKAMLSFASDVQECQCDRRIIPGAYDLVAVTSTVPAIALSTRKLLLLVRMGNHTVRAHSPVSPCSCFGPPGSAPRTAASLCTRHCAQSTAPGSQGAWD